MPLPHPHNPRCTGLTARWCPVHGLCRCFTGDDLDSLSEPERMAIWLTAEREGLAQPNFDFGLDSTQCPLHDPRDLLDEDQTSPREFLSRLYQR